MADLVPPSVFSKVAHQWVHKNKRESIMFVMYVLKTDCVAQARVHLQNKFGKSVEEAIAIVDANRTDCCTGFIIGHRGTGAHVLTCCHSLKEFYSAEQQLTREMVQWFDIHVMCTHQEEHLASSNSSLYDNANYPRIYTMATAVKVDGNKDLMLLEINMNHLYRRGWNRCQRSHVPLKLAKSVPPQLNDVVMISWPPLLPDTVVTGELTNTSRCYNQLSSETNKGYNMRLIELNMIGRDGCSGSPILNHEGEVVAVYHGRLHDKGYAASFRDVLDFLGPRFRQMCGLT
jgi:hypothetical protein